MEIESCLGLSSDVSEVELSWSDGLCVKSEEEKEEKEGKAFYIESDRIGRIVGVVPAGIQQDWT